jgi:Domain of unknown function (DUF4129)
MHSFFQNKRWILFLSVLALGALTVLTITLRDVSFSDAQPLGREESQGTQLLPPDPPGPMTKISLQSQIIVWLALLLLVVLIGVVVSPELRKRLFRIFIRVAFAYWAWYIFSTRSGNVLASFARNLDFGRNGQLGMGDNNLPPPVFEPPQENAWVSYLVAILFILVVAFLSWRFLRGWREYAGRGSSKSLNEIARIARSSLRDLSSGRESTDVIMNCYFRMSDVVADKRMLQRGISITPAEFAVRLEQAGLPGEAVRRLTRLFEKVRYGAHRSGPTEVKEAVACLTTILHYCGETV